MSRAIGFLLFSSALFSSVSPAEDLETCIRKDSISCVQIHVYKKLTALLSQRNIDLVGGFRIVKDKLQDPSAVASADNNTLDGRMYRALEVSERQLILEDLIFNKVSTANFNICIGGAGTTYPPILGENFSTPQVFNFFKHRTIHWNMGLALKQILPTARKLFSGISENMKQKFMHYVNEGRGKKKFMRLVVPVIIAFKMTVFTWVKVIYLGVALIAKKAFIISIIALIIAIFVAIKKHSYKEYRQPHYEIHGETIHSVPYYPVSWPSGGHSVHTVHGGHDSYDMHASGSAPAHSMAYAAQKPSYS